MLMHDGSVLLVGASSSIDPNDLRSKLQLPSSCSIVADTWMEASIAAGAPAPLQQHAVTAAPAAEPAAAAVEDQEPHLGQKRGLSDNAAEESGGGPAAKRQHTSLAETTAVGPLAAGASLPAAAAAAAAGNAQTADALKAIIASRLWVPAQQQLQQHQNQQDGPQQQQQQMLQQSADSGELQSQHHEQQQQQQQQPGRLDVSWMSSGAIRVLSYNILADMYATG
jgi:hypothetical protein